MWSVTDLHIPGRHAESPARRRLHGKLYLAFGSGVAARIAHEWSLADPGFARGSVKTRSHQIPVTRQQRHLRADELSTPAITNEQGKCTSVVEEQRIAPVAGLIPGAE